MSTPCTLIDVDAKVCVCFDWCVLLSDRCHWVKASELKLQLIRWQRDWLVRYLGTVYVEEPARCTLCFDLSCHRLAPNVLLQTCVGSFKVELSAQWDLQFNTKFVNICIQILVHFSLVPLKVFFPSRPLREFSPATVATCLLIRNI